MADSNPVEAWKYWDRRKRRLRRDLMTAEFERVYVRAIRQMAQLASIDTAERDADCLVEARETNELLRQLIDRSRHQR